MSWGPASKQLRAKWSQKGEPKNKWKRSWSDKLTNHCIVPVDLLQHCQGPAVINAAVEMNTTCNRFSHHTIHSLHIHNHRRSYPWGRKGCNRSGQNTAGAGIWGALGAGQWTWTSDPPISSSYSTTLNIAIYYYPAESWYSFAIQRRVEGWVDLAGWLRTKMVYLPIDSLPSK